MIEHQGMFLHFGSSTMNLIVFFPAGNENRILDLDFGILQDSSLDPRMRALDGGSWTSSHSSLV